MNRRMQKHMGEEFAKGIFVGKALARLVLCRQPEPLVVEFIKQPLVDFGGLAGERAAFFHRKFRPEIEARRVLAVKSLEVFLLCYQQMCKYLSRPVRKVALKRYDDPAIRPIVVSEKVPQMFYRVHSSSASTAC